MPLIVGIFLALLLLLPASAAANQATCAYDAGTLTVTVTVTPSNDFAPAVLRTGAGEILVSDADGTVDCGPATTTNTDTIAINKPTAIADWYDITYINLRDPFTGGATDEPGGSDEIEFVVNFPAGGNLSLDPRVSTSDTGTPLHLALGGNAVNLNAGEADGIDADLTVTGASFVTVTSTTFADRVIGSGGAGTGAAPFATRIEVCGGLLGGNDTFVGGDAGDEICGMDGDDYLDGGAGDDRIGGEAFFLPATTLGNDTIIGGAGDDELNAFAGDDLVDGGGGADFIRGYEGNDVAFGAAGKDRFEGGAGDDKLKGGNGRDNFRGGDGNDRLGGQRGRDKLRGEAGDDRHSGGPGPDTCLGGPGADTFLGCETQTP